MATKELDEDEYESWQKNFAEARSLIGKERESRTEELAEEIEQGLTVVGGTGVEDKLQVGVPEAVDRLARAGINIWVLTGDKVETAINIGYACRSAYPFLISRWTHFWKISCFKSFLFVRSFVCLFFVLSIIKLDFLSHLFMGFDMGCSLLRQGMDNLIVSLESAGARAIDEKAERENWSRGKKFEVYTILILSRIVISLCAS